MTLYERIDIESFARYVIKNKWFCQNLLKTAKVTVTVMRELKIQKSGIKENGTYKLSKSVSKDYLINKYVSLLKNKSVVYKNTSTVAVARR